MPGIAAAKATETESASEHTSSFRHEFAGRFRIGAALSENQIMGREIGMLDFVASQFNALTAENEMKWERIHPGDGDYQWESSDALVAFCQANDIFLTGHTLIWHQQTPDWVFEDENGEPASRELLLERMEEHINTIVGHFNGAVPSWDVVNEALNDDGTMRESKWQQIIGDDFVAKAFEFTHKADSLASDTRQSFKCRPFRWNNTLVFLKQDSAGGDDIFSLRVKQGQVIDLHPLHWEAR